MIRNTFPALRRSLSFGAFVAVLALGTATMRADQMNFAGTATGSFSGTPSSTSTLNTLTYYGSTFSDTSSNGYLAFGGGGTTNPATNLNNFGSIHLDTSAATYSNNPFELMVTFTNPSGIVGGQSSLFTATVFGSVSSTGNGGANIAFMPNTNTYLFSNSNLSGTFTLHINDVAANPGQTASVTGYITEQSAAVTPEPMSLMLLGTGLLGTAALAYRRRKSGDFSFGAAA